MRSDEILRREENERTAFSRVATSGRSAVVHDADLLVPDATIAHYGAVARGEQPPLTALEQMFAWVGPRLEGVRVLEICCHNGEFGAILARLGATVHGVDIAEPLIAQARRRAVVNGVAERLVPAVMSVHDLAFEDGAFDVVFGKASLHHLDLRAARDEIHRVLRPGGIGVFSEPVVLWPALRRLREMVPVPLDADSPDERPLSRGDLEGFTQPFEDSQEEYSRMLGRLDRLLPRARRLLRHIDRSLLGAVAALQRAAGVCTFRVVR
jgi:2-polyprenyl-3-methyl-5-hydroxy-6-metoxy-1,4-benzoquinol methylase